MSKILSRTTKAGSIGLVIDGTSATTYGDLPSAGASIAWHRTAEVALQEAVSSVVVEDLAGSGSGVEGARLVVSQEVAGSFRAAMTHEGMGSILAWCLGGTPSTTGASAPFTHTYPTGINTPFRSLVVVYEAADGTALQDEFFGLQTESIEFQIDAGGIGYMTCTVRGAVAERGGVYQLGVAATQTPAADAYTSSIPVLGRTGSILSYGGNSIACRGLSLSFTRPLDRAVDFGGDYPAEGVLSGPIAVTLQVTRAADEADTATLRAALMSGSPADLSINFTSGTKIVYLELSDAVVTTYSSPRTSGGALIETVTFTAQALTTGDYGFRVRVTNAASAAVTSNGTFA